MSAPVRVATAGDRRHEQRRPTRSTVACARRERASPGADPADALEAPPQLRLEDDDERQQAHDRACLHDARQQAQPQGLGDHVDQLQDDGADDEPHGARALDQAEEPVDQEGGQEDVEQRGRLDAATALDQFELAGPSAADCTRAGRRPSASRRRMRRQRRRSPGVRGRSAAELRRQAASSSRAEQLLRRPADEHPRRSSRRVEDGPADRVELASRPGSAAAPSEVTTRARGVRLQAGQLRPARRDLVLDEPTAPA